MNELLAVGASHKTAELPLRERIALTEAAHKPFLTGLLEDPAIAEAVVSRPATAPSSTSSSPTRWRRSQRCSGCSPAGPASGPPSSSTRSTRCATATRRAISIGWRAAWTR